MAIAIDAVPLEDRNAQPSCKSYLDTFDDLTASPVPLLGAVGTYHGLDYSAFVVAVSSELDQKLCRSLSTNVRP